MRDEGKGAYIDSKRDVLTLKQIVRHFSTSTSHTICFTSFSYSSLSRSLSAALECSSILYCISLYLINLNEIINQVLRMYYTFQIVFIYIFILYLFAYTAGRCSIYSYIHGTLIPRNILIQLYTNVLAYHVRHCII